MGLLRGSCGLRPQPRPGLLLLGLLLLPAVVTFASSGLRSVRALYQELHERAATESICLPLNPEEDGDLHCVCVKTTSQVHPKHITSLEVIKAGPHCATAQMIATVKNGRKICLDPQAPLYKRVIRKLLES